MQSLNIKEWKLLELQITQTRRPLSIWTKTCLSSTALEVFLSNVHKIGCAHVQCMNNHYAKFEY